MREESSTGGRDPRRSIDVPDEGKLLLLENRCLEFASPEAEAEFLGTLHDEVVYDKSCGARTPGAALKKLTSTAAARKLSSLQDARRRTSEEAHAPAAVQDEVPLGTRGLGALPPSRKRLRASL